MRKGFFLAASILGGVTVALGAFGAHGLKGRIAPHLLEIFEIGVRYQMYHVLALMAVAGVSLSSARLQTAAGLLFLAGMVLFSGSLYALSLTADRWWGMITPLGGLAFLFGWFCLALAGWQESKRD